MTPIQTRMASRQKSRAGFPYRSSRLISRAIFFITIVTLLSFVCPTGISESYRVPPVGPRPALISFPARLAHDSARFVNGDQLSGTVKAIEEGKVSFSLDLIGETAEFPLANFSELSFAGPPRGAAAPPPASGNEMGSAVHGATRTLEPQPAADGAKQPQENSAVGPAEVGGLPERSEAIYLRDGSYLSAMVTGLTPDAVEAIVAGPREPIGARVRESKQAIAVPRERVAGIGFYRPNDALFESDFSSPEKMGVVPAVGSWAVEKGQLVQASPLPFCRAYVPVLQTGVMRYEWSVDISSSIICGLAFFASRSDTRFGDLAYMATVRDRGLSLYKVIGEARHEGKRERINSTGPLVRFTIEYDPRNGEIVLWAENDILMRLTDPNPIQQGGYVVLHTEGRAAFGHVRVTHLVGAIQSLNGNADSDAVLLSDGDKVSGKILEISDKIVVKSPYAPGETAIDRGRVRSVVFASAAGDARADRENLPRVSLWNGDLIFANIVGMDARVLTLRTSFAPRLVVPRARVRSITFPPARSSASSAEFTSSNRSSSWEARLSVSEDSP